MNAKEDILTRIRQNIREKYDMPTLQDIKATTYDDPLQKFMDMTRSVGGKVIEVERGTDVDIIIAREYKDAKVIASNLPEIKNATINPDEVEQASDLNGVDVGVVRGSFGVAENGCVWIPQQTKQKAVCFISENLVILLKRTDIVNNMHEAYARLSGGKPCDTAGLDEYGYGTFISGPSKTADIAQVLVMGAQAARSVTVLLLDE